MEPGTPSAVLVLLDLSAGMAAEAVTPRGAVPACVAARFVADELIDGLVNALAAGYPIGGIELAVLGYRTSDDGHPQLLSLLPDGDPAPRFVPLGDVAAMPVAPRGGARQPRKWAVAPPPDGAPCAADALARAYQMVAMWLTGRYSSRPPVVVHCTSAAPDEACVRVARSLELLGTAGGPVRLLHYALGGLAGGAREAASGEPLFGRVFVDDWNVADPWAALFADETRPPAPAWAEAGAAFEGTRALWAPKLGNTPEQWEDAFAVDEGGAAAAIADGASAGIYCRLWARQLAERFLADRPDVRDPAALNRWVVGLRAEWRTAIDYPNLNWSKQAKVDQVGAAATLLGLELGPPGADGERPWRAFAVGDATLFWVRGGQLRATFPVVAADQFGSAPLLVRSNPGFRTAVLCAAGTCQPGDRFVLATDAVAAHLFRTAPDWDRFHALADDEWQAELDTLRRNNEMVNDDCTLVMLRVAGEREESEASARRGHQRLEATPLPLANPPVADAPGAPAESDEPANGT